MTEKNSTVHGRELGIRLRQFRIAAGLAERGAAAKLGVSTSTICRIERGTRNPTLEEVASLLGFYDVKPAERAPLIDMTTLALSTKESVELMSRLMHSLEDDPDVLPQIGWPPMEEEQP